MSGTVTLEIKPNGIASVFVAVFIENIVLKRIILGLAICVPIDKAKGAIESKDVVGNCDVVCFFILCPCRLGYVFVAVISLSISGKLDPKTRIRKVQIIRDRIVGSGEVTSVHARTVRGPDIGALPVAASSKDIAINGNP